MNKGVSDEINCSSNDLVTGHGIKISVRVQMAR